MRQCKSQARDCKCLVEATCVPSLILLERRTLAWFLSVLSSLCSSLQGAEVIEAFDFSQEYRQALNTIEQLDARSEPVVQVRFPASFCGTGTIGDSLRMSSRPSSSLAPNLDGSSRQRVRSETTFSIRLIVTGRLSCRPAEVGPKLFLHLQQSFQTCFMEFRSEVHSNQARLILNELRETYSSFLSFDHNFSICVSLPKWPTHRDSLC